MEQINVGLLGVGTVGSGVLNVIHSNKALIEQRLGAKISINKCLVKNIRKKRGLPFEIELTDNPADIINDPDINIVVEVMGGLEPAKSLILSALEAGKNIVTANKELMAKSGNELLKKASEKKVDLYFEASVAGGIPIIHPLKESLAGNSIKRVLGILNGTTNYILTKMEEGLEFSDALRQAQEAGFAESDPSADIEGRDPAAKIAIVASIAFGSRVSVDDVYTEGITSVGKADIQYADNLGYAIKLIALAQEENGVLDVRVHPTMIDKDHPLASVKQNYNAVFVEGDAVGELMFFGQGAGGLPTASAVVGDIIDIARNIKAGATGMVGCTCFDRKEIKPVSEIFSQYYMRMLVSDEPGVLAKIAKVFGDNHVSLNKVLQTSATAEKGAEVIFVTHKGKEANIQAALKELMTVEVVKEIAAIIRSEVPKDA